MKRPTMGRDKDVRTLAEEAGKAVRRGDSLDPIAQRIRAYLGRREWDDTGESQSARDAAHALLAVAEDRARGDQKADLARWIKR